MSGTDARVLIASIMGYTTIGCWLCAQLPQVVKNIKLRSCEGLALPFLVNWLFGQSSLELHPVRAVDLTTLVRRYHQSDRLCPHRPTSLPGESATTPLCPQRSIGVKGLTNHSSDLPRGVLLPDRLCPRLPILLLSLGEPAPGSLSAPLPSQHAISHLDAVSTPLPHPLAPSERGSTSQNEVHLASALSSLPPAPTAYRLASPIEQYRPCRPTPLCRAGTSGLQT